MNRVTFPSGTLRCDSPAGVRFRSLLNDAIVVFDVPGDVLISRFGAGSRQRTELINAFEQHRTTIESAARAKLHAEQVEGRIALSDSDFDHGPASTPLVN